MFFKISINLLDAEPQNTYMWWRMKCMVVANENMYHNLNFRWAKILIKTL
jgi:hypothetical protein